MTPNDGSAVPGVSAGSGARAMPALPVRLDTLTPEQSSKHMAELTTWVQWLTNRYRLDQRTIPPCWAHHGELVEELSALHTAWLSSYALTSPGGAPLAWHEALATCRTRMQDSTARSGCSRHGCRACAEGRWDAAALRQRKSERNPRVGRRSATSLPK